MPTEFHRYLFEQIKRSAKPETLLAQELMALLRRSKANTYKKMSGEVMLSAEETVAIARHFGISLDQYVHSGHGDFDKLSFDYSLPQHQPRSPAGFLEKVRRDLERVAQIPQVRMLYASNEVPLFHSLVCRNLTAFKLYVWSRTNWRLPEMLNAPFDPDDFYARWPEVEEHRHITAELYQRIPSKEYWPRSVAGNILNQIRYYADARLFKDPKMPALLCTELHEMLESRAQMAAQGNKGSLPDGEAAAPFDLYLNEIAYTNNIVLICSATQPLAVYTTVDNPNFLRSTDTVFCKHMSHWVQQIEDCSYHCSNEQHRLSLFGDLQKQVLETKKAISKPK